MKAYGRLLLFGFAVQVTMSGCGGGAPLVPVQGRVILGGHPLVGGTITLIPLNYKKGDPRPEGDVDDDGNYSLKTNGRAGAPLGKYRATLTISGKDRDQSSQFNPTYSHWEKSPLLVEIVAQRLPGTYDLKLQPRE